MNDFLWETYNRLIADTKVEQQRFLYYQFNLDHRLTGIIGPRGVGKTTLMLQYIKNNLYQQNDTFYFSADNMYFNTTTLLEFVDELYRTRDIKNFFIDEIHKYNNWSQELKNIYDSFPQVKVVFSGSSAIDIVKGTYDLSRRANILNLPGLSFREYLNIKTHNQFEAVNLSELLKSHTQISADISQHLNLTKHFQDYMLYGYYPIIFQEKINLYETLQNVINKTIYEDIANYFKLKTENLGYFKRIINFLASIPPGKINTNNVARHLGIDHKTAEHYLDILKRTSMIKILYPEAQGNQILTKPDKVYLDNTTLLAAMNTFLSVDLNIGTERELAFIQSAMGAQLNIFSSDTGDFQIDNLVFEVGGKNKTSKQLQNHDGEKYLVKDQMVIGFNNQIPLYLFGFLY